MKKIGDYKVNTMSKYFIYSIDGLKIGTVATWAVLPDGSSFGSFYNPGINGNVPGGGGYLWIFVDINAKSGPNKFGRDVFMLELYRGKRLRMWGGGKTREDFFNGSSYPCKKGTYQTYAGGSCGALIQYDGWEIKEDYPW